MTALDPLRTFTAWEEQTPHRVRRPRVADAKWLRQQDARCRTLARGSLDRRANLSLLGMAEEMETKAALIDKNS